MKCYNNTHTISEEILNAQRHTDAERFSQEMNLFFKSLKYKVTLLVLIIGCIENGQINLLLATVLLYKDMPLVGIKHHPLPIEM